MFYVFETLDQVGSATQPYKFNRLNPPILDFYVALY